MLDRRDCLRAAACGFGYTAFAAMCNELNAAREPKLHHVPRVKRIIFLFMHGGPSQVDTFDYKPRLQKESGKKLPFAAAPNVEKTTSRGEILASPWKFEQRGESGLWVSELFPHVAEHIDELCVVRSMHSRGQSHGQALCMLHTGSDNFVRPSVGAWVSYGLGRENADLPAFLAITPPRGHGGPRNYGAAFLPASHQATVIGHSGIKVKDAEIANLDTGDVSAATQRRQLDLIQQMNSDHLRRAEKDSQIEGVIESFEMAYRMQSSVPGVMDLNGETEATRKLYGIGEDPTDNFGRQCLLARRFAEAGVRYIQVSTPFVWDQHGNLKAGHEKNSKAVDKPIAGLLSDLNARGLMDDTLVLWGGEFGRTPVVQGKNGRDHNPQGFTVWMAGAGVKHGIAYGKTDEYGYYAVEDKVHMHDLHATLLHLLGVDHERLTYRYAGRDFRLTDVYGRVVKGILS